VFGKEPERNPMQHAKKKNQLGSLQCGILTPETLCVSQSVFLASVTISHVGLLAENTVQKNKIKNVSMSMPVKRICLGISPGKQMAIFKVFNSQKPVLNLNNLRL